MKSTSAVFKIRAGAVVWCLLLCVVATNAVANTHYNRYILNSNLHNQCTNFSASVVEDTSFTVSAECNKLGDAPTGGAADTRNSTQIDLSGNVRWDEENKTLGWDTILSDTVKDIADACTTNGSSPFTYSASDVTLALTCSIPGALGATNTQDVSLPLNGNLKAGSDGNLSRR